jgi:ATP-dependent Clp protease ATP-binding subunit ClpC
LGLSGESVSVAAGVLRRLGVEYDEAREQVVSVEGYGEAGMGDRARFTPRAKKALEVALRESLQQGYDYMRTDHLLLGLLGEKEGISACVLLNLGVDPDEALRETREILRTGSADEEDPLDRAP